MLLVLTTSDDATADYLCGRLLEHQIAWVRLDTDAFANRGFVEYSRGQLSLTLEGQLIRSDRITNVWYRRPRGIAIRGAGTDAQRLHTSREWGAALDSYLETIPVPRWMNHPSSNARANNKLLQLRVAQQLHLLVPDTIVTRSVDEAKAFWSAHNGRIVTKPLSVGYVETRDGTVEAQILTSAVSEHHLCDAELLPRCPTLLQQRVAKGVDVRVTIVDGRICALAASMPGGDEAPLDIRENGMAGLSYERVDLPTAVATSLFALCAHFALRFAAVDLIKSTDGQWYFLEINPNGQWAWLDLVASANIATLFANAFGHKR